MIEQGTFDLGEFLTDSLSLQANTVSPTRASFKQIQTKDLCSILKELDPREVLEERTFEEQERNINRIGTPIQEFFRDLNVLITGSTGYIGKLLTEKIVRSVPNVGHVYLLIRPKKGQSTQERFDHLLLEMVFRRMREEVPWYRDKLTAVAGDLSKPGLGLSHTDRKHLCHNVHVVFHSAADVKFTEPLRSAISSNVLGTKHVLKLVKDMKHLKCFLYESTAFSHCVNRVIKETIPLTSIHYKDLLEMVNTLTDEELEEQTPRLMQGWPNTYVLSKAICENMLQEEGRGLPLCVHRPSVVWPAHKEPFRGWTDNLNGHMSSFVGVSAGVLHCYKLDLEVIMDMVPVDCVVNSMIAAAWQTATHRGGDGFTIPVYNYTLSPVRSYNWKDIDQAGKDAKDLWPYYQAFWYQSYFSTNCSFIESLSDMVIHRFQGLVFDMLAVLQGNKFRLSRVYKKGNDLKSYLQYFTQNMWVFENDNVMRLWDQLTQEDKQLFHFDLRDIDFKELTIRSKLGLRNYVLKEKLDTIPAAERKNKWFVNKIRNKIFMMHSANEMQFNK